jgi:CDP-6-deoxy-D-xylo-4-hexulose-3-dehydrase
MNDGSLKLIKSTFFDEENTKKQLADFIIASKKLSMGEECQKFEHLFSSYQERKYTVSYNSGSSANLALIQSLLNLGRLTIGDEVAFSAVTWATNVMPIIQLGLKSIPVDINIQTLNVSSELFLNTLNQNPKIKCLFVTNLLGFCDDLDRIASICSERGIILLEDNCESFGSRFKGVRLGSFGLASTCSTYVGHHLSTIEGGVVSTDDVELYEMLKMVRAHGWDRSLSELQQYKLREDHGVSKFYDLYTFYDLAYNIRPTEITGYLGSLQIKNADLIVLLREKNYIKINEAVEANSKLISVSGDHMDTISNFAFPVICKSMEDFSYYIDKSIEAKIEIRPIVGGNMVNQPFYKKYMSTSWKLDGAEFVHHHGFYLPNNPELTEDEISRISHLLQN